MIKTQIQVEAWQHEAIKRVCSSEGRSMSDFIREAVSLALQRKGPPRPLAELAGKYQPAPAKDLKTHDAAWAGSIR